MKTIIITIAVLVMAVALKTINVMIERKRINSVGAKSNNNSKGIAKYDIANQESIRELVNEFKDLAD